MFFDLSSTSIHQLIETQVSQTPDAIAVVFQEQSLTYRELNQKANQLAHYLKAKGVQPEVMVGICVDRSIEMIVALLGILKAGGAYIPLDPTYPAERLALMLQDSQAPVLITQQTLLEYLPPHTAQVVCLDRDWGAIEQCSLDSPAVEVKPDNLAYVIYTSGSTGTPKGVAMPHLPLVNLLTWQLQRFKVPAARTLQFTPINFDVSFQEIFSTLAAGGLLVLVAESTRRNAETLLHYISEQAIERLFLPFVALQHLAEVAGTALNLPIQLREVITAGEQLKITRSVAQWFCQLENCTLYNQYGPSESHVVTEYMLSGSPKDWTHLPPIGRPIANTEIYLLAPASRRQSDPIKLAAAGEAGEVAIGGIALARGYLNRPELTNSKFIANPFSEEPDARLYKTGDLARYLPDGSLEYIERIDNQIKIRGVRIELGEIEVTLSQFPSVKESVVVVRDSPSGGKRLIAYVVADSVIGAVTDPVADPSALSRNIHALELELRAFTKAKLPSYMIPSVFVLVNQLPLTPSGKVDRRALPEPTQSRPASSQEFVPPRTPTEEKLALIWSQTLEVEPIGIHDNFFDFGGDSLRAIQTVFRIREVLKVNLPTVALFDAQTVANLAEIVDSTMRSQSTATSDDITVAELEAETVLDPIICTADLPSQRNTEFSNVFFTGATGFLGAFLVHELLEQTSANVYCLVRSSTLEAGKQKIQANLERYFLWRDVNSPRIIPVLGDLAQPLLGISAQQFHELSGLIDCIYHNAAAINLIYPYSALRNANVLGTQELLKLATQIRVKPVHFISTMDVFQTSNPFSSTLIREDDALNPHEAIYFDGYTKSKWVSEQMVTTARSRGVPVSIYRPAMLLGHSSTGAANVNDLMCRLLKGFIQLGSAPSFEMMINIAPIDYFSRATVYLSKQAKLWGKSFNLTHPQPLSMGQFVDQINACGYSTKQVNHEKWESLLKENMEVLDPLVSVLTSKTAAESISYLERCSVGASSVDCQNVLDGLEGTSIACPSLDSRLFTTWFSYFNQSGFLKPVGASVS
jgi:amino acid adenylation domain-containing protein/thioester reductase-like protein